MNFHKAERGEACTSGKPLRAIGCLAGATGTMKTDRREPQLILINPAARRRS
jgi:hypothetical protein